MLKITEGQVAEFLEQLKAVAAGKKQLLDVKLPSGKTFAQASGDEMTLMADILEIALKDAFGTKVH